MGKRGIWGEKLKMRIIFAKFPLLSKAQMGLSSDFMQFFLVKNNFVYFYGTKYDF